MGADLFGAAPTERATRDGWHIADRRDGRAWKWRHWSGVEVLHCGHPTALRPYYTPGKPGTYRNLKAAQAAALEA
jgi:hypothetical protein